MKLLHKPRIRLISGASCRGWHKEDYSDRWTKPVNNTRRQESHYCILRRRQDWLREVFARNNVHESRRGREIYFKTAEVSLFRTEAASMFKAQSLRDI
jgi:hypothetical protein